MLRHLLIVAMLSSMTATLSAQNTKRNHHRLPVKAEERSQEVCTIPEQLPVFPGGEHALLAYVAQHLKYPEQAIRDSVQGVVQLRFVVLENGRVGQVQSIKFPKKQPKSKPLPSTFSAVGPPPSLKTAG